MDELLETGETIKRISAILREPSAIRSKTHFITQFTMQAPFHGRKEGLQKQRGLSIKTVETMECVLSSEEKIFHCTRTNKVADFFMPRLQPYRQMPTILGSNIKAESSLLGSSKTTSRFLINYPL